MFFLKRFAAWKASGRGLKMLRMLPWMFFLQTNCGGDVEMALGHQQ